MEKILKYWQTITIGVLIVSYLTLIVFMHQPLSSWFLLAGGWLLLVSLTFLGTVIGTIGVLVQSVTKNPKSSAVLYKAAYKLGSKNATILTTYGLYLLRQHKPEEALVCFDKAMVNTKYFMSIKTLKCNRAIALWKLNRLDEAVQTYTEVIKDYGLDDQKFFTEPTYEQEGIKALVSENQYLYPQDYTTLGFLHMLNGNYVLATFFTQAALEKKETFASAYDNLGQINYYQGDLEAGKVHFDKALELDPNLSDSLYFRGMIAKEDHDTQMAHDLLSQARACSLDGLNTITYEMIDTALEDL